MARALVALAEHPVRARYVPRIAALGFVLHELLPSPVERMLLHALRRWHFDGTPEANKTGNLHQLGCRACARARLRCARAATVHLSGDFADVARSEALVARGGVSDKPFVLLVQPSLFDASRAPAGQHIAWAYCHVPNGSSFDMAAAIEAQIERAAPAGLDR